MTRTGTNIPIQKHLWDRVDMWRILHKILFLRNQRHIWKSVWKSLRNQLIQPGCNSQASSEVLFSFEFYPSFDRKKAKVCILISCLFYWKTHTYMLIFPRDQIAEWDLDNISMRNIQKQEWNCKYRPFVSKAQLLSH